MTMKDILISFELNPHYQPPDISYKIMILIYNLSFCYKDHHPKHFPTFLSLYSITKKEGLGLPYLLNVKQVWKSVF